ncbi:MAG: UvrD-helicase domain-containing protein, partial [Actinomycetota bacterium]
WRTLQRHASQPWTISDLPLIDELGELMGTMAVPLIEAPSRISAEEREIAFEVASATFSPTLSTDGNPGGADISGIVTLQQLIADYLGEEDVPSLVEMARGDSSWLFAHIVVDEAQDVTAMQWRALNRRCLGRSMTIVGDPDQQARPGDDWWIDRIKAGLGVETVDVHSLHINYRTPAELMAPAQQLRARSASPDTVPTQYVRNGSRPWAARCEGVDVEVVRTAVEQARAELGERGRLAVISGQRHAGIVAQALEAFECAGADNGTHRLLRPVAGFLATEVKGLEFDAVLVVDPKTIEAESGWRQLYVVLTRPTRHLGLVMVGAPSEFEARWLDTGAVAELPVLQNVC